VTAAIALTVISALSVNWAYAREHESASQLPPLSIEKPIQAVRLLTGNRRWLTGFAVESMGFLCYVAALALAPLAVVQTLASGGVAVLAFFSSRLSGAPLARTEIIGVAAAVLGLSLFGISLAGSSGEGSAGDWIEIAGWLGLSGIVAALAMRVGHRFVGGAVAHGIAAGILFAAGDVATKTVVSGGSRIAFLPAMIAGYAVGTTVLQLGFQRGGALTTAGTATLLTSAIPIVGGTVLYDEPFPDGALGVARGVAFVLVIGGGVLLARPQVMPQQGGAMREGVDVVAGAMAAKSPV
jgi:drug/metabolite transporter (DMT)-like permease